MTPGPASSWRRARGAALSLSVCLALAAGTLTSLSAGATPGQTLSSARQAVAPETAPVAESRTPPAPAEVSLLLLDLWLDRGEYVGPRRRLARSLLSRPTSREAHRAWRYPDGAVPEQRCGEWVCVSSLTTGRHTATQQWSKDALRLVEQSWSRIVDDLGYRAPAPDGTVGGDHRFDVYLADLPRGDYGFCAPDAPVPGHGARASAYCVLDNDMAGFGPDPLQGLAATAAHELFHAVQYNYDTSEDRWFMEASATWIEEQVFDEVNDNRQFVATGQLGDPLTPLDSTRSMYGNWIFVQWLSQQYGASAVRQVWERLDASTGARNEWSLQAVARLVDTRGGSWPRFFAGFARANLRPARHYEEGAAYRPAAVTDRVRASTRPRRHRVRLRHLTSHTLGVTWGAKIARRRSAVVRVRTSRAADTQAQVLVSRKNGTLSHRTIVFGPKQAGTARIKAPGRVRRLVIVISHTSIDHRRCGRDSGWSCGGQPAPDLRVGLTTRLAPRRA